MIQRIQSIYLFFASLFGGSLFALPFASGEKTTEGILVDGLLNIYDQIGLLVLTVAVMALAFLSIFLFNNRKLQMNIGKINLLLVVALLGWAVYLFINLGAAVTFGIGLAMPVLTGIMTILANKNILKDEKLVRSADRIR